MRLLQKLLAPVFLAAFAASAAPACAAQDLLKIRAASLTLPVINPVVVNVMKMKGFDKKHGFDMEIRAYPSISAFYMAIATGDVDTLMGGPIVLQKMRSEGVDVKIVATMIRLSDLVVLTADPAIRSLADLKGKTLAADMGSQQFQVTSLYAHSKGVELGSDVTVVQASFALARAQLVAGRVDAAMVIEPIATAMMREDPKLRIIFNGSTGWKEMTGTAGWELVVAMRGDFIKSHPEATQRWIAAMKDTAEFMHQNPRETDAIAVATSKLPAGILEEVVAGKRWEFDVLPAWGPERVVIGDMVDRAVAAKFLEKPRDDGLIYAP